jgi:hypothetical protein
MTEPGDYHMVLLERLQNPDRPALLEHMGMTVDEFIEWRQTGLPPKEGK